MMLFPNTESANPWIKEVEHLFLTKNIFLSFFLSFFVSVQKIKFITVLFSYILFPIFNKGTCINK